MAKGNWCQISNCKNRLTGKGRICGTHRWRKSIYKSYDPPTYTGSPNYLPEFSLPEGTLKICPKHGELDKDAVYPQWYRGKVSSYNCRQCMLSNNIKRKYSGMSGLDDQEAILAKQGGVCAMCKGQNNTTRNGKIKRFNIDHCHKTGKVRGVICSFCNSLLGYSKDSIEILESAILYLKSRQ